MFCIQCGKEVLDEAVVCPNCGCLIGKIPKRKGVVKKDEQTTALSIGVSHILLFIAFGLACLSVMLFLGWVFVVAFFTSMGAVAIGVLSIVFAYIKREKDWLKMLTLLNLILAVVVWIPQLIIIVSSL